MSRKQKKALAKFRMANHVLEIIKGRHNTVPIEDRLCQIRGSMNNRIVVECECHALFEYNVYQISEKDFQTIVHYWKVHCIIL